LILGKGFSVKSQIEFWICVGSNEFKCAVIIFKNRTRNNVFQRWNWGYK
jgi:hypothetical protein